MYYVGYTSRSVVVSLLCNDGIDGIGLFSFDALSPKMYRNKDMEGFVI